MRISCLTFLCLLIGFNFNASYGQTSPCTSNTPHYTIDLSGDPNGVYSIAPVTRQGLCCGAQSPDACIMATITLDSNAVAIQFEITSGAVPPGALYYQIGCSSPTKVGEPICLSGAGPHILTFCKPGNNQNGYAIRSIPRNVVPDSVAVDVGCDVMIGTLGYFVDSTLKWFDKTSSDGRYLSYLDCTKGCDTVTVTPDYKAPAYIDYQVCGNLLDTICQDTSSYLCRDLRVYINSINDTAYATICGNELFELPDGSLTDSAGTHITVIDATNGCDSTIYTILTVNPAYEINDTIISCDSASVNGKTYYSSQTVIDSFTTIDGCDSVVITDLTINFAKTTNIAHTSCDSALINGNWFFNSQLVTDSFLTSKGCDSIVFTELTINYRALTYLNETFCDSGMVNGNWYFSTQLVTDSFLTDKGCDSIVYTNLTIHYSTENFKTVTRCDSANVNGKWYYSSQIVVDSFLTSKGCDSIVFTDLTINYSTEEYFTLVSCDSARINGNLYFNSQMVVDYFKTSKGCDSIIYTDLTINYMDVSKIITKECDSSLVNGNWYYSSQLVTDTFSTIKGCDSIVFTYLTINSSYEINNSLTSCDSALINGNWYYASQVVVDSFLTRSGCDSVIITDLTINYSKETHLDVISCQTAFVRGEWYDVSGQVVYRTQTSEGCDSTVYTTITINPIQQTYQRIVDCDSTMFRGVWYTESTTIIDSSLTYLGCDSIHRTDIEINPSYLLPEEYVICEGEKQRLPTGQMVGGEGTYRSYYRTASGCDSVILTTIVVIGVDYDRMPNVEKCLGDEIVLEAGSGSNIASYEWSTGDIGPYITTRDLGTYLITITAENGCKTKDTIKVLDAYCPACPVFTPTAFTYNYDGLNEDFHPVHSCDIIEFQFDVYNRWGEHLYSTTDPNAKWDGNYMGEPVQQDVYVWILRYTDEHALIPIEQSGTVTVIRR